MKTFLLRCRWVAAVTTTLLLTWTLSAAGQTTLNVATAAPSADQSRVKARYSGSIVSHVDSYGSGTGSRQRLSSLGQMTSGFDYGDPAKTDWKASINWRFLMREGESDVYQIEWNYKPKVGAPTHKVEELSFDGVMPAKLVVNEQWVISIEPEEPPAEGCQRERIGSALGQDVFGDQLKGNPPTYDEVVQLFMAPAMEEFEQKHFSEVEMTDDEVRAAVKWQTTELKKRGGEQWENWQVRGQKRQAERPKQIAEAEAALASPETPEKEKKELCIAIRLMKLEETSPNAGEVWYFMKGRKFEQYLYENYGGGRISHQQFGPEALDARRKLLLE